MDPDFEIRQLDEHGIQFKEELDNLEKCISSSYENKVELVDSLSKANNALESLKKYSNLVLDCEGVRLGRAGKLTLIQLGAKDNDVIYLFDVLKLGDKLFGAGMKELLESELIVKYMFDCKKDSESLFHEYRVTLKNVLDMQIHEYLARKTGKKQRGNESLRVCGLGNTVKNYVKEEEIIRAGLNGYHELKKAGDALMNAERMLWRYRPLSKGMKRYAAMDIEMIRVVAKALENHLPLTGVELERVKIASDVYLGMRRDPVEKPEDKFVQHSFMLSYVIPEVNNSGEIEPFPTADFQCTGCKRLVPKAFIEQGNSFCRDCVEILKHHGKKKR